MPPGLSLGGRRDDEHRFLVVVHEDLDSLHVVEQHRCEDRTQLRVAVERVRQALRDMLDEHPVWRAGTKDAAVWLGGIGLATDDLAQVFSVSADTVRRWTNPENSQSPSDDHGNKVVVVAKIVNHLRHAPRCVP